MKVILLGCGGSTGVPKIGNDWGACDPTEPRNRRSRVSVVIENDVGQRILVDTSTDCRAQLLAQGIDRIDAVIWTHDHADHCHGIDDLRVMRYGRSNPIPGYASAATARLLRERFAYIFAGEHGYPTLIDLNEFEQRMISGFMIDWVQMPHGPTESTGLRFEADGKTIVYATDFSRITSDMLDTFDKTDVLVTDCLRERPHPTHAHLAMALELGRRTQARQTVLTHLDASLDYQSLCAKVGPSATVGFDGLEIEA